MSGPSGRAEFFSREADDYLRQLEPLLEAGTPPLEALVRLARGLRGASMLAGPATFARAAGELESLIRRLREGSLRWSDIAPRLRSSVSDFIRLASVAPVWSESSDREAESLARGLRQLAGSDEPPPSLAAPSVLSGAAARGYIARETAVVAGALERAAALSGHAADWSLLSADSASSGDLRRAMQPLRGLAALADFPPLGDLIDAIDAAVVELSRAPAPAAGVARLFSLAAEALGRIARAIAADQDIPRELPEAGRVADALFSLLAAPDSAVPVADILSPPGAIQPYGGEPAATDPVDLAGLGDTLRQAAEGLRAAGSETARRLRTFALIGDLRTMRGALGQRPAGPFLARLLTALERDPGFRGSDRLIVLLDRAGQVLSHGADLHAADLEASLQTLASEVPAPPPPPDRVVPIEALLDDQPVPIESLLEDQPVPIEALLAAQPVPIEALLADQVVPIETLLEEPLVPAEALAPPAFPADRADRTAMERSLSSYHRLITAQQPARSFDSLLAGEQGPGEPPLFTEPPIPVVPIESLLAGEEDVVSIETLLVSPAGRSPAIEHRAPAIDQIVPIDTLLYRGRRALERAEQVRHAMSQALTAAAGDLERLEPLLRELLDLVPLALDDRP